MLTIALVATYRKMSASLALADTVTVMIARLSDISSLGPSCANPLVNGKSSPTKGSGARYPECPTPCEAYAQEGRFLARQMPLSILPSLCPRNEPLPLETNAPLRLRTIQRFPRHSLSRSPRSYVYPHRVAARIDVLWRVPSSQDRGGTEFCRGNGRSETADSSHGIHRRHFFIALATFVHRLSQPQCSFVTDSDAIEQLHSAYFINKSQRAKVGHSRGTQPSPSARSSPTLVDCRDLPFWARLPF